MSNIGFVKHISILYNNYFPPLVFLIVVKTMERVFYFTLFIVFFIIHAGARVKQAMFSINLRGKRKVKKSGFPLSAFYSNYT